MLRHAAAAAVAAAALTPTAGVSAQPLHTGFVDAVILAGPDAPAALARSRAAGATFIRLVIAWRDVAPTERPVVFRADDPGDPAYRWDVLDRQVRLADAARLTPIINLVIAPDWASDPSLAPGTGVGRPSAADFARFARAGATRYSGRTPGLPRVRYWQAWNEPNLDLFWLPQFVGKQAVSPEAYRDLVNAFADAVHGVDAANVVVAGGLSPFGFPARAVAPLRFMRELLCMSDGPKPRPTCRAAVRFDVWAHHPYTSGGPTHSAHASDDASLGDLPQMSALVRAAQRARHIVSRRPVELWVTEFSWDSNPPDPKGVPLGLQARWVAEAMYRMWTAGVSLVTWFSLRDRPVGESYFQSSLFHLGPTFHEEKPKPAFRAFRFPVVAIANRGKLLVWGKVPSGRGSTVVVEQRSGGGWRRLATLRTDASGIFRRAFAIRPRGWIRATVAGERSLPFAVHGVRDRFYNPFGLDLILDPPKP